MVYKHPIPFREEKDVLYIHFLNIGEGDCTFIEIPTQNGYFNFLIDVGTGGFNQLQKLLNVLGVPFRERGD